MLTFTLTSRRKQRRSTNIAPPGSLYHNLGEFPGESLAEITGFAPGLTLTQQLQLQAYGLAPGCQVRVVQQRPVTILRIDELVLALENELASLVLASLVG
jgi:Fe2+ transport system protein FeoA